MYKLKQIPEDFIVKEISNLKLENSGKYLYFKLKKKERNTMDAIKEIAKKLNIREKNIGFAGSKDRQAVTEQLISIFGKSKESVLTTKINNVSLEYLGNAHQPISLGDLEGNYFEIVVRDLDETINIDDKIKLIPNYFDEQRFSQNNVKIGKHLLKKEFKEALVLIDNHYSNQHLNNIPNDFIGALNKMPSRLLRIYINAYQSYLWNETLRIYLEKNETITKTVKYSLSSFAFVENKDLFEDLKIPIVGFNNDLIEGEFFEIIKSLMDKESITYKDFIIRQMPELSLEGEFRKAFVEIKGLNIGAFESDELNPGKHKVKIIFSLPKGSYATMVMRALF
ncbi:MAG: tRNA pseudouridine(13) synthase TruD [Candidatus Woesearchaeota archaeon]